MKLTEDGTVIASGDNKHGECNVQNWRDIIAVARGDYHTVGLKKDGTVLAVGDNGDGQRNVAIGQISLQSVHKTAIPLA